MRLPAFAPFLCRWPLLGPAVLLIVFAAALLLGPGAALGQGAPLVTGVAVSSAPSSGDTYGLDETIRVTLTFNEVVNVTGRPQLKIDMDPAEWGEKEAAYESGSGTNHLTFAHTVVEPNISTQGIAVLADSLELSGGTIQSASSQTDADLSHAGLDHDPDHKVDWQLSPVPAQPGGLEVNTQRGSLDVSLDWHDVDRAADYLVRWRSVDDGEKLNEGVRVQSSEADITVDDYGDWVLRVEACNDAGCGKHVSRQFRVEPAPEPTPTPGPVPAKPSGLSVTTQRGSLDVSLDWQNVDGAADYLVRWRSVDNGEKLNQGVRVEDSEADITVAGYGDWVVRVEACNESGCGEHLTKKFTVEPAPVPAQPAEVRVSTSAGSLDVSLDWDDVEWAESYLVRWRWVDQEEKLNEGVRVESSEADITVSGFGQQAVRVKACNDAGCGESTPKRFTVEPAPEPTPTPTPEPEKSVPGSPANLAVSATDGRLVLSTTWDALEGADSYQLSWREADGAFDAANVATVTAASANITVSVYGQWVVRLEGCNDAGCGPSVEQAVSINLGSPANLAVSATTGSFDLSVSWEALDGVSSYELAWKRAGLAPVNSVTVSDTRATISVSGSGRWLVRVLGCNDDGCGPAASQRSVRVTTVGAPDISTVTAALTWVKVEWTAPSNTGGLPITGYDLRYITSDALDKQDTLWTVQENIWTPGEEGDLSYTHTGLSSATGYDFQVRAVNAKGDGAWSATMTATTATPSISGAASISYPENAATRVATFRVPEADEAEADDVSWTISGTDASHFHVNEPKGALRLLDTWDSTTGLLRPKLPDFESPDDNDADGSYSIKLTATIGGTSAELDVTVALTDVDEPGAISLSPVRPKVGTALTAALSDPDTVSGTTTWTWQRSNGRNSWATISGATDASYAPAAADSGQYLRVKATYTDGHGADKSAEATAHHVVIASVLTGLTASTTDSDANGNHALTPGFQDDVLHYKIGCADADTMTVTPAAADGVRLAVNGTQTISGEAVQVAVTKVSDVIVRASGADGGFTDYVLHCVQGFLADMTVTEEQTGEATEALISFGLYDYLTILDHHGVPRYRHSLGGSTSNPRMFFRFYQVGEDGEYRYHYTTRPTSIDDGIHFILDEDFQQIATVSHVSPLTNTGIHDFRVLPNGNYLLMSYEDRVERDLSAYGYELSSFPYQHPFQSWLDGPLPLMQDSGIQIVSPSSDSVFSWKSWGKLPYEDCTQHWADRYAHVNLVQYLDGNIVASFRGCSKVMSIDTETGEVVWQLGRTNLEPGEWVSRGLGPEPLKIVGDPEGEFCGQHGAELHPDGRLTLFDNGEHCVVDPTTRESRRTSGLYARALEYALDFENGEAVFLYDHSQNGTRTLSGTRGGHVIVLDNGDWLISWARQRQSELAGYGNVEKAITQVDPRTGRRKLAFDIPSLRDASVQANIRATAMPAYALAPQPAALSAAAPASERTFAVHTGDDDSPQALLTFNRPIVDFAADSPSLSVTGGTVASVTALVADGEAANAYLITFDPTGTDPVALSLVANQACSAGGICAADGTVLSGTPAPVVINWGPLSVTGVAVSSDAGDDDTYAKDDTIRVTVSFSQPVDVTGAPQLKIDLDPAEWGEKEAGYEGGSGTASLTFAHAVVEPNVSTQGIAVLANTLELNGGSIKSASSQTDADLSHAGLGHDPDHKVDWQHSPPEPTPEPTPEPAPTPEPDGVQVSIAASPSSPRVGESVTLTAAISDPPADSSPSYNWEIGSTGGEWSSFGRNSTLSFLAGEPESWTFRVTVSYDTGESATSAPVTVAWSRAPMVNTQAANYAGFTNHQNAPRGILVGKSFAGLFTDPDGDNLTYSVSLASDHSRLVEELTIGDFGHSDEQAAQSGYPLDAALRVWFTADADDDWKAMDPRPADRPVATVRLTATDPGGLTASVDGDFLIRWVSYPEVESAVASRQAIALIFDMAVEATPGPTAGQFTVNVANGDGTTGTIAVSRVSVSGAVVTLELASELVAGQMVTVDYVHAADTPLKRDGDGGDHAPGFTGQAVDISHLQPAQQSVSRGYRGQLAEVLVELSLRRPAPVPDRTGRASGASGDSAHTTSIVYVIDDSGSMDGDFPEVRTALKDVRGTAMTNTKVALIKFGTSATTVFGLTDHSTDATTGPWTDARINDLSGKMGGTYYSTPLWNAKALLDADTATTTKKIIFLTDAQKPRPAVIQAIIYANNANGASDVDIVVDTIGFGDHHSDNFDVIEQIATDTGGAYRAVNKPSQGTTNTPAVTAKSMTDILKGAVADNTATLFLVDHSFSVYSENVRVLRPALTAAAAKAGDGTGRQVGLALFLGDTTSLRISKYRVFNSIGSSSLRSYDASTGSTDVDHGLSQAFSTVTASTVTATSKRVVLITDGISAVDVQTATLNSYKNNSSVTLDVVAWGEHADRAQLKTWADSAGGTFSVARVEPDKTEGLGGIAGDATISIYWTDPMDSAISKYQWRHWMSIRDISSSEWTDIPGSGASTTGHIIAGLDNGVEYVIGLRALRGDDTPGDAIYRYGTPMASSIGLSATAGDTEIALSWNNPNDADISKYQYAQRTADGAWSAWTDIPSSSATTTSHTVASLTNGTAYTIALRAVKGTGDAATYDLLASVTATPVASAGS